MLATIAADPYFATLSEMLSESDQDCRVRESTAFARATEGWDGAPVVLFGAGGLGRKLAEMMRQQGLEIAAFADNNPQLWGTNIGGAKVISPADAARLYGQSAVFVVSIWSAFATGTMEERFTQLRSSGCRCVVPFQFYLWQYPDCLPYFNVDLPSRVLAERDDVSACMELWSDDSSRREYVSQVRARLYADFREIARPGADRVYFPDDLITLDEAAVYVDAGAFDGDSLKSFIEASDGKFQQIVAYEPDPANYAALTASVDHGLAAYRDRISARQEAVSNTAGKVSLMTGLGMSSRIGAGEVIIDANPIDSLLGEDIHPTFLKYDVEGFEADAIEGSRRTIASLTPTLAICVYHLQNHLWRLPLAVHRINPNYHYHLRPYGFIWDEVCYAVPKSSKASRE